MKKKYRYCIACGKPISGPGRTKCLLCLDKEKSVYKIENRIDRNILDQIEKQIKADLHPSF